MKSSQIRQAFLDFFRRNDHTIQDSSPLLTSDPDLLFNIAGMVPFKPYFLGNEDPPASRITTAQKCLRTEDIDQVGETARHLTFFEMLGNFSFGDYFKEEAIQLGWDFLVEELELAPDRLWITVFGGDESDGISADHEAEDIWHSIDEVPEDRILHLGKKENFWAMGETGPCGPCSEILYDQESKSANPNAVKEMILDGKDRILELWNLVFMEFQRPEPESELEPLPDKNIDTGLGLERLAAILQDAESNFGTDLFVPLINEFQELASAKPETQEQSAVRVVADHVRSTSFLIAEGLLPGNEGQGYILRRLIRRAHLRGRRLGLNQPFLGELVPTLIDIMGDHFSELEENQDQIQKQLHNEETQFERILDEGLDELDNRIESLSGSNRYMKGSKIFDLYETHGLPIEMTKEVLDEKNIDYDEEEIEDAREEHEERSRNETDSEDTGNFDFENVTKTEFTGYDELERETEIVALFKGDKNQRVETLTIEGMKESEITAAPKVVLETSPFYAEGGGQSGDRGWIKNKRCRVFNTIDNEGRHLHGVTLKTNGEPVQLSVGEKIPVCVDQEFRRGNMRHHTATHLLHHALRRKLGDQVIQDGSSLDDKSLRFDFTHNEAVNPETLDEIEKQINDWIYQEIPIETEIMNRDEAEERGALAFFGEHYGQEVRVVMMVDEDQDGLDSKEFCGGTHLNNTGQVGLFTITNETAVASGVRRIEAKAGYPAYEELKNKQDILRAAAGEANINQTDRLPDRVRELREKIDEQEDTLEKLQQQTSSKRAEKLADSADKIGGISVVHEVLDNVDDDSLKTMVDEILKRFDEGLVLLISRQESSVRLVMGVSDNLTSSVDAGNWIQSLGTIVNGGGGGRSDFAQAGGSDTSSIPQVLDEFQDRVRDTFAETARN